MHAVDAGPASIAAPVRGQLTREVLRQRCRHCRGKLAEPVSDERKAFCTATCRAGFFRTHCAVCKEPMQRKSASQKICGKRECRSALRARTVEIPFVGTDTGIRHPNSNSLEISTAKTTIKSDLRSVLVAGPELVSGSLHCALIPDGPGARWEGGKFRRAEAENRAALRAAEWAEIAANGSFAMPNWKEVVSSDGVKCLVTRFRDPKPAQSLSPKTESKYRSPPADLSVPNFLRRTSEVGGAQ
jgi:hypothetical protein